MSRFRVNYFEIGSLIVEEEQGGETRAKYGKKLLTGLSEFLECLKFRGIFRWCGHIIAIVGIS